MEHFQGTRRSVLTLICGVVIGFAAGSDTALLLGIAWLVASFGYAETRYLTGERARPILFWTLGIVGLAGVLLVQKQYLTGTVLGVLATFYALQAWRVKSGEQRNV